jgi:hypothetical protein
MDSSAPITGIGLFGYSQFQERCRRAEYSSPAVVPRGPKCGGGHLLAFDSEEVQDVLDGCERRLFSETHEQ